MLVQNNTRKGMKVQKLTLKYQHYVLASFVLNLALFLQNSHHKSPVRLYSNWLFSQTKRKNIIYFANSNKKEPLS